LILLVIYLLQHLYIFGSENTCIFDKTWKNYCDNETNFGISKYFV